MRGVVGASNGVRDLKLLAVEEGEVVVFYALRGLCRQSYAGEKIGIVSEGRELLRLRRESGGRGGMSS